MIYILVTPNMSVFISNNEHFANETVLTLQSTVTQNGIVN